MAIGFATISLPESVSTLQREKIGSSALSRADAVSFGLKNVGAEILNGLLPFLAKDQLDSTEVTSVDRALGTYIKLLRETPSPSLDHRERLDHSMALADLGMLESCWDSRDWDQIRKKICDSDLALGLPSPEFLANLHRLEASVRQSTPSVTLTSLTELRVVVQAAADMADQMRSEVAKRRGKSISFEDREEWSDIKEAYNAIQNSLPSLWDVVTERIETLRSASKLNTQINRLKERIDKYNPTDTFHALTVIRGRIDELIKWEGSRDIS